MRPLREFRRARQSRRVPAGPLRDFLDDPAVSPRTPLNEARLLAIDTETTGLDPRRDRLLSVGFVPVDGLDIVLGGARSFVVSPDGHEADSVASTTAPGDAARDSVVGQSAVIHGLTDDDLTTGAGVDEVMDEIFTALRGRVTLAHHARIEVGFLRQLVWERHGFRPYLPAVDTLELQSRIVADGFDDEPKGDELRLWEARQRFGLPITRAHEAQSDALACAELYLAQTRELSTLKPLRLGAVLSKTRTR